MAEPKYNFFAEDSSYKDVHEGRSCARCAERNTCSAMVKKDFRVKWLDLARCGCHSYREENL